MLYEGPSTHTDTHLSHSFYWLLNVTQTFSQLLTPVETFEEILVASGKCLDRTVDELLLPNRTNTQRLGSTLSAASQSYRGETRGGGICFCVSDHSLWPIFMNHVRVGCGLTCVYILFLLLPSGGRY